MNPLLSRLVELESEVAYRAEPEPGRPEFKAISGHLPVLLSAPHGAAHLREGRIKEEDEFTAGMVRLVAEKTGAHALYTYRKSRTDPNYYANVPYKQVLKEIVDQARVKFVLDIHGCAPERDFGLALGTMCNQSCPRHRPSIVDSLAGHGFSVSSRGLLRLDLDRTFTASGNHKVETVTQFAAQKLKIPAAQLEINARLRIVQLNSHGDTEKEPGDPDDILRTVNALLDLVWVLESI